MQRRAIKLVKGLVRSNEGTGVVEYGGKEAGREETLLLCTSGLKSAVAR